MTSTLEDRKDPIEELREHLRDKIKNVIDDIDNGFKTVMFLYKIAFYFGIVIILFGIIGLIVFDDKPIFAGLTITGVADFIAFFIFKPIDGIQKSRASLAQVIVGFLTWYNDIRNWSKIIELEINNNNLNYNNLKDISSISVNNSIMLITALKLLMENKKSDLETIKKTLTSEQNI